MRIIISALATVALLLGVSAPAEAAPASSAQRIKAGNTALTLKVWHADARGKSVVVWFADGSVWRFYECADGTAPRAALNCFTKHDSGLVRSVARGKHVSIFPRDFVG